MFDDPKKYFQTFTNTVNSCNHIDKIDIEGPYASRSWEEWQIITIGLKCSFHSGERLEVFEGYSRKNIKKSTLRNLSYQFMRDDGSLIFRIDSHGCDISLDEPCHLHIGKEDEVIEDGDARLAGFSLRDIHFLTVFSLVLDRIEGQAFPWE